MIFYLKPFYYVESECRQILNFHQMQKYNRLKQPIKGLHL